jgi:hypothetical protein
MRRLDKVAWKFVGAATLVALLLVGLGASAWAQTNPPAQTLPYTQDFSGLPWTSTTLPAGWQGWQIGILPTVTPSTFSTAGPTADVNLIASGSAGSTSGAEYNYDGKIGALNSGTSGEVGICLALNTLGLSSINVTYDIMTIRNPYNGTGNTRINEETLQYRVGTSGAWTTLTGIEYQNNTTTKITAGDTTPQKLETKTIVLPGDCNNQAVVQIRWNSRQVSGGGSRPSWAIDNIGVTGTVSQETGACCHTATGACTITLQTECPYSWLGPLTICTPVTCPVPDPTAACCNPSSGACTVSTLANCAPPLVWHPEWATCTPNLCPPTDRTLCEIAADDPVTYRPALEGNFVRVTGLALVNDHQWQLTNDDFEITDGGCCVSVFAGGTTWPTVLAGDLIEVVGTVGFYNGKTEITTPSLTITVLSSGNPLPPPAEITTFELATQGENYDDCFIKIRCVEIVGGDPWPIAGSNANIQINDGSGVSIMRIDKETDIDGTPAPTGKFTVIGLGTQFDSTAPFSDGYQILPRSLADLLLNDCVGACCDPVGNCTVTLQTECLQPSVWHPEWNSCIPNNCPIPTGACCDPEGHCTVTIPTECLPPSMWHGEWATCDVASCPLPVGACCFLDGHCELLTQAACTVAPEFVSWVAGATCLPENPCLQPGACCDLATGACTYVLQQFCVPPLVFNAGLACVPNNPCPQPGACCNPDTGACTFVLQGDCPQGWAWFVGVPCAPSNPCPPPVPTAACCDPQGGCTVTTQAACLAPSVWHPEWVSCTPNYCPPPVPTENTSWGRIKATYR